MPTTTPAHRFQRFAWIATGACCLLMLKAISASFDQSPLSSHLSLHWKSPSLFMYRSWDYYAQHGTFTHNESRALGLSMGTTARFLSEEASMSLAESGMTGLEEETRLGDGLDELHTYLKAHVGDEQALEDIQYLRGKTVLLLGDSVDRLFLDFATTVLAGSSLDIVDLHTPPHDLSHREEQIDWADPHHLTINPSLVEDANVWFLMGCGITSGETEWQHKDETRAPRALRAKVKLLKEAMDKKDIKPDLIIMHTALWDLATANLRDTLDSSPPADQLSLDFLAEYREKTKAYIEDLKTYWPDATLMARLGHRPHVSTGAWFAKGLSGNFKRINRQPFATNKMDQLNEIMWSIIEADHQDRGSNRNRIWPFDLPHAVQDYKQDFDGDIHFGKTGKSMHLQMLLYYVKNLKYMQKP